MPAIGPTELLPDLCIEALESVANTTRCKLRGDS